MTVQTEYLVDRKGHKKSVVMSMRSYQRLMDHLQDLEDALELKSAKKSSKNFVEFDQFAKRLKVQGRVG